MILITEYYTEHRDHIIDYLIQYRIDNNERLKEFDKNRYNARKEKMLQRMAEKYTCACGSISATGNKSKHEKTKKHQAWLLDQKQTAETI